MAEDVTVLATDVRLGFSAGVIYLAFCNKQTHAIECFKRLPAVLSSVSKE